MQELPQEYSNNKVYYKSIKNQRANLWEPTFYYKLLERLQLISLKVLG
ncbi:hypothetical protein [Leptospira mayottensis]|nr:hypothetical protein [Leptospira mayottensis]